MTSLSDRISSLGFLGAGNMAGALIRGTAGRGILTPRSVFAYDIDAAKLADLQREIGIGIAYSAEELTDRAETIVLAVKPQQLDSLLKQIAPRIHSRHLLISIAAGIPLSRIAKPLPGGTRLIRVMPNTPALVGLGAAGVARGEFATDADLAAALALFEAVGVAIEVGESEIDSVTAISGSGPAYFFRIIELMQQAGEEMGLSPDVARRLTLQTALGAARMAADADVDPAELRRRVTSPGGTTAAAIQVFDERNLGDIFKSGLHRARARAAELAQG